MAKPLVSDNQGREAARIGRKVDLERSKYQVVLTDGTMTSIMEAIRDGRLITIGPMPIDLVYPDWVRERLTPELEVTKITNPGEVELYFSPSQKLGNLIGNQVHKDHEEKDLLKRALSFGHLKWYEENSDQIPDEWIKKGLWVYGMVSKVRHANGNRYVPYLDCDAGRPCVCWCNLVCRWGAHEPSGLLATLLSPYFGESFYIKQEPCSGARLLFYLLKAPSSCNI